MVDVKNRRGNTTKQDTILNILGDDEWYQTEINKIALQKGWYGNYNSARVGVSVMLNRMLSAGLVSVRQERNENSGSIDRNVWSVKR